MKAHTDHNRTHKTYQFVYPVLSRRSKGISLGVNLSPHRKCNFDCLYCQVDRGPDAKNLPKYCNETMEAELKDLILSVVNGDLFETEKFKEVPAELRRLNDIAFSGDGEPTAEPYFLEACNSVCKLKHDLELEPVKVVLISNSTMFHKPKVQEGLDLLMKNNGEIWAKLDAGTEEYYKEIDKTHVPFQRVLDNILGLSKKHNIIIQTLFTQLDQQAIPNHEVEAYAQRLKHIVEEGGQIKEVHLHTIARPPAYSRVESLTKAQLDEYATLINNIVNLPITTFAGRAG